MPTVMHYLYKLPWWTPIHVISSKREVHTYALEYVMYGNRYVGHKTIEKTFILNNERVIIVSG